MEGCGMDYRNDLVCYLDVASNRDWAFVSFSHVIFQP